MENQKRMLYIILVLLNIFIGRIQLLGQIILTEHEFEFFAGAVVDNETCKKENFLLKQKEIEVKRINDSIKRNDSLGIVDLKLAIKNDTTIRNNYKKDYKYCSESKGKLKKWNKFWKNTTVSLTIVVIIETGLIYFTFKK